MCLKGSGGLLRVGLFGWCRLRWFLGCLPLALRLLQVLFILLILVSLLLLLIRKNDVDIIALADNNAVLRLATIWELLVIIEDLGRCLPDFRNIR